MQEIVQFIVDNWQLSLAALLSFISFILALIRKRPAAWNLTDYVRLVICQFLPTYIVDAENMHVTGERKKEHVLSQCMKALKSFVKCTDKELESSYLTFSNALEEILNTPQKKDVKR